jgi:hypothetical protein
VLLLVGPGATTELLVVVTGFVEPPSPVMPNHSMSAAPLTGMLWVTPLPYTPTRFGP